jgi:hypothetical protein
MKSLFLSKAKKALTLNSFQFAALLTALGTYFNSLQPVEQGALLSGVGIQSPALAMAVAFLVYVVLRLKQQASTVPGTDLTWSVQSFLDKPSAFFALVFAALCAGWESMGADRQSAALAYANISSLSPVWPMLTAALTLLRAMAVTADAPTTNTGIDPTLPLPLRERTGYPLAGSNNRDGGSS